MEREGIKTVSGKDTSRQMDSKRYGKKGDEVGRRHRERL